MSWGWILLVVVVALVAWGVFAAVRFAFGLIESCLGDPPSPRAELPETITRPEDFL